MIEPDRIMKKLFTPDEKKIVIFLISFLIFGIMIINTKKLIPNSKEKNTFQDSLRNVIEKSNEPFLININEADIETLAELPGIGPARAKKIYDRRITHGNFQSLFELMDVKGIGKKTLAKLIPHLEIIGDSTKINEFVIQVKSGGSESSNSEAIININSAGQDELITLYRIGEVTAKRIIDYRNKKGNFNSIQDLKNVKGIGDGIFEKIKERITIQ